MWIWWFAAIPFPHPDHPGRGENLPVEGSVAARQTATHGDAHSGCKFAARCPHAMPMCIEHEPPLFQTDKSRAAACYLFREAPTLERQHMASVIQPPALIK